MQDLDDRIADRIKERQGPTPPPLIPGSRTTEFWIAVAALVPWAADQFGIDYDMVIDAAGDVAQVVQPEGDGNLPMLIAAIYVAGRIILKYFRGR
jgi:hypothetical protein